MGAEEQENFLAQQLVAALKHEGCHVFQRHSRQRFSDLSAPAPRPPARSRPRDAPAVRAARARPPDPRERDRAQRAASPASTSPSTCAIPNVLRADADKARSVMEKLEAF